MFALLGGLAAGLLHVFSGPDHLAALAPLATREPQLAAGAGLRWGLGHGAGVVLLGGLGVALRGVIDVEALSAGSERLVGLVLIGVGAWSLRAAMRLHRHPHAHSPDEEHAQRHDHLHSHPPGLDHAASEAHTGHGHAAFGVGMLHGAAGTGHLFGVLPSLALAPADAIVWLGAYFIGAVGAMAAFGFGLGRIAAMQGERGLQRMLGGSGLVAIGVGMAWIGLWPV